jgi:hypothetical protein
MVVKKEGAKPVEAKPKEVKLSMAQLSAQMESLILTNVSMQNRITDLEKTHHMNLESINLLQKEVKRLSVEGVPQKKGPKSTREMTEDDARRVVHGDLKEVAIRKAAEVLGLSYGQVYSAKGGYTFKGIMPEPKGLDTAKGKI